MAIQVEVWGEYACFTRPEMKTERVSYDCMTPSAARGLLESIYWHPGLMWRIDRIHVCRPIRFTNIRRNEVKDKISARNVKTVMERGAGELYLAAPESIQQRAAMVLQDVRYVIDAHFDLTEKAAPSDSPGKFQDIVKRRLERGQRAGDGEDDVEHHDGLDGRQDDVEELLPAVRAVDLRRLIERGIDRHDRADEQYGICKGGSSPSSSYCSLIFPVHTQKQS